MDRGIEAASWSSEVSEDVRLMVARELLASPEDCTLRLLYTTPEALRTERLRQAACAASCPPPTRHDQQH